MDGTLVISLLDFNRIRAEAGVPEGMPVLEFLQVASPEHKLRAQAVLREHELRAARQCQLRPGAVELLLELRARGLKLALLTRNSRDSVELVLKRFCLEFDCTVAREDARPKPHPEPILKIAEALALDPSELLVVGDYIFDVQCGQRAGALTALLRTGAQYMLTPPADIVVDDLLELLDHVPPLVRSGMEEGSYA